MKNYALVIIIITLCVNLSFSQSVNHWETIVEKVDPCKYLVPTNYIGTEWMNKNFDDSNWTTAPSSIGFGDNDDNTVIPTGVASVYIRYSVMIKDKDQIAALLLDVDYDDGFIAYLNGTEIASGNISTQVSWNMTLYPGHEAVMYNGKKPDRYDISMFIDGLLIEGQNVLAVEVHNASASSSDLSSNIFLHAGITTAETVYGDTPDWFWEPIYFTEFNLPLMIINTNGQSIPKVAPRIVADMGIIYNGEGVINRDSDTWNEYSGKISIKQRGESSSGFLKKSYTIELQNEDGSNNNVSILGLPAENDFVLYGPYSDKTMIKNVLTYELYRRTGKWAPRTKYIEIILNGDYRGVYVLTESLKRDKNRIKIDKLTSADTSAIDMSGGYILRRDKTTGLEESEYWRSPVEQPYNQRMTYQYYYPKFEDLTTDQANYIRNWMQNFDEVMSGDNFNDPETGYSNYIKVESFIDMMFINEISKGIDNYLFSTYFYKENDEDGGKLAAGAPWDYNLGYGNLDYGLDWDAPEPFGWCYTQGGRTYWFKRLIEDEVYLNSVYCRWSDFRFSAYSNESILSIIDSCVNTLGGAIDRNYEKFPKLGEYIWPAKEPIPDTYDGEIENLKSWLLERLEWMDGQWLNKGTCGADHDLAAIKIPAGLNNVPLFANNIAPELVIRNKGLNEEINVPVTCEIDSAGIILYSETITVDNIESLEVLSVTFPVWRSYNVNTYNVRFLIQLSTDEDKSNDILKSSINVTDILDDFETGFEKWTSNAGWGIDDSRLNSGEFSMAINPGVRYENNQNSYAQYNYAFDLTSTANPQLTFWSETILADGDTGFVEISTDGGSNWDRLGNGFSGLQSGWVHNTCSLKNYTGFKDIRFRFHFISNDRKTHLGWFIDDVKIENSPTAIYGEETGNVTNEFELFNNYPNPFNPSTTVSFTLPEQAEVELKIFNMLGQNVGVLVKEIKQAGFYEMKWNAANLPSGIYFISIKARALNSQKNFTQIRKAILLK